MSPRDLDWRSVERKLTRIRRFADQLEALGPFDAARFQVDPVAGLAYLDVDHARVAEAVRVAPVVFGEYVRQAARWFAERAGGT